MEENISDKILACKDCRSKFTFTVREQKFFGQHGWPDPVRCPNCRRQKKILRLALDDGVSLSDKIRFSEICDKCGTKFFTTIKRKPGVNLYCDNCWKEIKFANPKAG